MSLTRRNYGRNYSNNIGTIDYVEGYSDGVGFAGVQVREGNSESTAVVVTDGNTTYFRYTEEPVYNYPSQSSYRYPSQPSYQYNSKESAHSRCYFAGTFTGTFAVTFAVTFTVTLTGLLQELF
ncbi:9653_t:CDS:2 [Dentiscutata erythropus]|uniref:9653_t:CDS:1 n=1 Tax=Dentiscutata erythropus TaxID=1348616 RepID=A0A9N9E8Y6_9GLOM|nr:9653_t:CDS:2 [Dentiscutata erythropus]